MIDETEKPNIVALLPLVIFLILFIGTGIFLTFMGTEMAFYQLSATVAILPAICISLLQGKSNLSKNITIFLYGMGEINIVTMCLIYLLAGAFASVTTSIGCVSATVNFALSLLSPSMILPGFFLIGAFISTAMGTSMGTIAAIAPIAVGVGQQTDISLSLLMGVVIGGAMFGDNLSFISDTTIAATRSQNCEMKDKFRMNFLIALPAALITIFLLWASSTSFYVVHKESYEFIKVLPYLVIIVLAIIGINVFVVLAVGILFSGILGLVTTNYSFLVWGQDIYKGFLGMNEIFVLSMLIGGLGELIRYHGGIAWLLKMVDILVTHLSKRKSPKVGEWCIGLLVTLANLCVANNTVAIILTGKMSKEIADKHGVSCRKSASLLDIFSCVIQGLIPYGAQLLLAGSISQVSPFSIAIENWYCMALFLAACISIWID